MTRWLCQVHARAGLARDVVCCDRALLCVGAVDVVLWYRTRIAAKSVDVRNGIAMTRLDPGHARRVLVEHAARTGKRWAEGSTA